MRKFLCFLLFPFVFSHLYSQAKFIVPCDYLLLNKSKEILLKQVGIKEKTNKNDGKEVEAYLASVNLPKGFPYCAAGQYYCWKEATKFYVGLYPNPVPKTASANGMYDGLMRKGIRGAFIPDINDLIVWKNTHNYNGHIERIIDVNQKGWVVTVGFNTSSGTKGNQRDGAGVYVRQRNVTHFLGRMYMRGLIGFRTNK